MLKQDEKLSALAEGGINQGAADVAHPGDEEDEENEEELAVVGGAKKSPSKAKSGSRR